MWIAFNVSILVMDAVRRHPEERSAFQRQGRAHRQKILKPFVGFESAMRQQSVIRHTNAQAAGHPPQKKEHKKRLPGEHEERCDGPHVKCCHKECSELPDGLSKCAVALQKFHGWLISPWWIGACFYI